MRNRLFVALLLSSNLLSCASEDAGEATADKETIASEANVGKADWSFDPCTRNGWYGDGECDWFCPQKDTDCGPATLFSTPSGEHARYPVVLHHGFAGGHKWIFAWDGVKEALESDGNIVVQTEVPPFDAIEIRAEQLRKVVDDVLLRSGAAKVNIIAHSMGGLDARYLITTLGYGDRVASLTTISTPHYGTNAADLGLRLVPGVADPAVNALAELLGTSISDMGERADVRAALEDLSEAGSVDFNAQHPNDERVVYESWAGVSSVLGLTRYASDKELLSACDNVFIANPGTFDRVRAEFIALAPVIGAGKNGKWHDGLVAVKSSKWGRFRGCIPADHSEEVGQFSTLIPNPNTGFDHRTFYRTLVGELAAKGL